MDSLDNRTDSILSKIEHVMSELDAIEHEVQVVGMSGDLGDGTESVRRDNNAKIDREPDTINN